MKPIWIVGLLLIQACSNLPVNIKTPPTVDIQPGQVSEQNKHYQNYPVRWGGTVIEVNNDAHETVVQVMSYPLGYYGRPKLSQAASGRFSVKSSGFLDPEIFKKDTEITVAGSFIGMKMTKVDQRDIAIPLVDLAEYHIWPAYKPAPAYYHPYYPYYRGNYRYGFGSIHYGRYPYSPFYPTYRPWCD